MNSTSKRDSAHSRSRPSPPSSWSRPRFAKMTSPRGPPLSVSSSLPPEMKSCPASPLIVSEPSPPRMKSHPRSPLSVSLPSPPRTRSGPRPALTMSAPRPARTKSAPASALIVSSPARPSITSRCGVPVSTFELPFPITTAAIAPVAATSTAVTAAVRPSRNLLLRCAIGASSLVGGCPPNRSGRTELRSDPRGLLRVRADLGEDPLEARLGVAVHERHRRGHCGVHARDLGVERVGHRAVGRMALAARAQLDQVHRLARVHVEHVAEAVAQRERVVRELRAAGAGAARVLLARALETGAVQVAHARLVELVGHARAQLRAERLPLNREEPVALQVAEGAVVRHHLEAVPERLEAAAGAMPAVAPVADQLGEHCRPLVRREVAERGARLVLGDGCRLEQQSRQEILLASVHGQQPHRRPGLLVAAAAVEPEARRPALAGALALLEVGDPLAAPVRP